MGKLKVNNGVEDTEAGMVVGSTALVLLSVIALTSELEVNGSNNFSLFDTDGMIAFNSVDLPFNGTAIEFSLAFDWTLAIEVSRRVESLNLHSTAIFTEFSDLKFPMRWFEYSSELSKALFTQTGFSDADATLSNSEVILSSRLCCDCGLCLPSN